MKSNNWLLAKDTPEDVLKAFYNLKRDVNFNKIMEWLKSAHKDEHDLFDTTTDINLYWCQGRSQALKRIISAYENSEAMLLQSQAPSKSGGR